MMPSKKGYNIVLPKPTDDLIPNKMRGRYGRGLILILSVVAMFSVPTLLVGYWGSFTGIPLITVIGGLIGFRVGGYFVSRLIPDRFLVNNAEWVGYVTENIAGGEMVPYGPGLHVSYPWEQRNQKGNYSLEVLTLPFQVKISTVTSQVLVDCDYEFAINLPRITQAIGINTSTVENGLVSFMANFLTSKCSGPEKDAEWVRGHIDDLNEALSQEFGPSAESFATKYGFITVSLVINKISFPESVQATRDAIDKAANMHTVVAKLYGMEPEDLQQKLASKEITVAEYNKMLNRALVESGNAKMGFNVFEADIPALLAKLAEKFTKE
jgi:hypothetical protein